MFKHQGIWLPDGERHFPEWMEKNGEIVDGRGTYQIKKWRACIPWIKQWRCAVDVGAHVGFWTLQMSKRFEHIDAFEPIDSFRSCWIRNLIGGGEYCASFGSVLMGDGLCLHSYALGNSVGSVYMKVPKLGDGIDSGGTHVSSVGLGRDPEYQMRTLDSFDFQNVDFIKIDCEGYEHHVIEGAAETLARCKPCVIVEQKPHKLGPNFGIEGEPAVDLLRKMGAYARTCISGDWICSWD